MHKATTVIYSPRGDTLDVHNVLQCASSPSFAPCAEVVMSFFSFSSAFFREETFEPKFKQVSRTEMTQLNQPKKFIPPNFKAKGHCRKVTRQASPPCIIQRTFGNGAISD
jgi:hypothetical protein